MQGLRFKYFQRETRARNAMTILWSNSNISRRFERNLMGKWARFHEPNEESAERNQIESPLEGQHRRKGIRLGENGQI